MTIRNIVVKQLIEVLSSLPTDTTKIDLEYIKEQSKLIVYPSEEVEENDDNTQIEPPSISPDEDLTALL